MTNNNSDRASAITIAERALRNVREIMQRETGEHYASVGIDIAGEFVVYVHQGGMHTKDYLEEAMDDAVRASAPGDRAKALREQAARNIAEAAKLEGIS